MAKLTGLSGDAARAQDYVCNLPARIRKLAQRASERKAKVPKHKTAFSWVYGRAVEV